MPKKPLPDPPGEAGEEAIPTSWLRTGVVVSLLALCSVAALGYAHSLHASRLSATETQLKEQREQLDRMERRVGNVMRKMGATNSSLRHLIKARLHPVQNSHQKV